MLTGLGEEQITAVYALQFVPQGSQQVLEVSLLHSAKERPLIPKGLICLQKIGVAQLPHLTLTARGEANDKGLRAFDEGKVCSIELVEDGADYPEH